jgi:site-specific DNA-methyltransferase (adenine-specific)
MEELIMIVQNFIVLHYVNNYAKKELAKNENGFPDELKNTFILWPAENLKALPDNSVHLMITSPPYNVSKEYDEDLSLKEYLEILEKSFMETYRVLINEISGFVIVCDCKS